MGNKSLAEDIIDFAGISINASPEIKSFTSATSTITLYNLLVNGVGQYSATSIFHQSADNEKKFEQIQAGWVIHPKLYGESRTRLYSHWTVPLDYAFPKICRPMYDDYELKIEIYKDGDYYLLFQGFVIIGCWPENLFNELRKEMDSR